MGGALMTHWRKNDWSGSCGKKEELKDGKYISTVLSKQNKNRVYNLEPLLAAIDGDSILLKQIIKEYTSMKYQEELFSKIEKFERDSDFKAFTQYLHKVRGSLSHFQVESINNVLNELKVSCKNKDVVSLNLSLKRLKNEYLDLKNFLIEYCKE